MKYLLFTLVDSKSGISLFKEPAKNSAIFPEGLTPIFSVTGSLQTSVPLYYTEVADTIDTTDASISISIPKEEFFRAFKLEIEKNLNNKKLSLLNDEFTVGGFSLKNHSEYKKSLIEYLSSDLDTFIINLNALSFVEVSKDMAKEINNKILITEQSVFRWCISILNQLQSADTTKSLVQIARLVAVIKMENIV